MILLQFGEKLRTVPDLGPTSVVCFIKLVLRGFLHGNDHGWSIPDLAFFCFKLSALWVSLELTKLVAKVYG